MKLIFFYISICVIFILVTFFGLGPVLYADGPTTERMLTLFIVLLIYTILITLTVYIGKKQSKK